MSRTKKSKGVVESVKETVVDAAVATTKAVKRLPRKAGETLQAAGGAIVAGAEAARDLGADAIHAVIPSTKPAPKAKAKAKAKAVTKKADAPAAKVKAAPKAKAAAKKPAAPAAKADAVAKPAPKANAAAKKVAAPKAKAKAKAAPKSKVAGKSS